MQNHINAKTLKEQVSLVDFLARLGYAPAKKIHNNHYYESMLRDDDNDPSFAVNDKTGQWYDHGPGYGGNIIDFGLRYWKGLPFPEVLQKIVDTCGTTLADNYIPQRRARPVSKTPNYGILEIKELGHNAMIMNYLESRGIARAAEGLLKEVYYYVENDDKKRYNFFAAGWQNETGSWVVRSLAYPISLGPNAISFLPNSPAKLSAFEGFFDYLSWLTEHPFAEDSILVLNSVSNIPGGIAKAQGFKDITTYFDHDNAGRNATSHFKQALPHSRDGSAAYSGYKDYNEKIIAQTQSYDYER